MASSFHSLGIRAIGAASSARRGAKIIAPARNIGWTNAFIHEGTAQTRASDRLAFIQTPASAFYNKSRGIVSSQSREPASVPFS